MIRRASIRLAGALDRGVIAVAETFAWLVLGVVVMLFGQLPMRDVVGRVVGRLYLQMNDFGQLFHATVFLVGIPYAIVTDRHVRLDVFRTRFGPRARAIIDLGGHLLFVLPWCAILAYFGADPVWRAISLGERFPNTGTEGYPLMRVSFVLFLVLLAAASTARVLRMFGEAIGGPERA